MDDQPRVVQIGLETEEAEEKLRKEDRAETILNSGNALICSGTLQNFDIGVTLEGSTMF